jgi:hypothetical protein
MKLLLPCMASLSIALALLASAPCAGAEDRGTLTLSCKGTAIDNDDPQGRDERAKSSERQGKATIDFDAKLIDFLHWNRVGMSEVTYGRIQADRNAFETGTGYHIRIDRTSGDVSFQTLVHDAKTGETWFNHTFAGKCAKADKQGRPVKAKPEAAGF